MPFKLAKLFRTYTFIFSLAALTSVTGGLLAACSAPQTDTTSNTEVSQHSGMHHGEMDLGPADAEYDLRFIDAMIPHHEGAIAMAKAAQEKSQRPEMQQLAREIISAQEREIAQLKQWRKTWYPDAGNTPMAYHAEMGHSMPMTEEQRQSMMMTRDLGAVDAEFDRRFIRAMIPHHEGAVEMGKDALNKTQRAEIRQLSQAIVSAQEQEIEQMKQWEKSWYQQ